MGFAFSPIPQRNRTEDYQKNANQGGWRNIELSQPGIYWVKPWRDEKIIELFLYRFVVRHLVQSGSLFFSIDS